MRTISTPAAPSASPSLELLSPTFTTWQWHTDGFYCKLSEELRRGDRLPSCSFWGIMTLTRTHKHHIVSVYEIILVKYLLFCSLPTELRRSMALSASNHPSVIVNGKWLWVDRTDGATFDQSLACGTQCADPGSPASV